MTGLVVDGLWTAPEGRGARACQDLPDGGGERERVERNSQLMFPSNSILPHTYFFHSGFFSWAMSVTPFVVSAVICNNKILQSSFPRFRSTLPAVSWTFPL